MKTTPPAAAEDPARPVGRWTQGWNRFWFRPADPTTLGLIRICAGLLTLYVHLAYSYDLQEFFGKDAWYNLQRANEYRREAPWVAPPASWEEQAPTRPVPESLADQEQTSHYIQKWGVDPHLTSAQGSYGWSIWFHVTDPTWMGVVHGAILVVMFLFTIGLATRVTSIGTWLAALCYVQRSPTTLFGMDAIMMIVLLYLMIGPSGAALSVDRLLSRWWAAWRGGGSVPPLPQPRVSANVALRLMQVHFCIIYLAAGLSKLLGGAWWNGTALWWTLANYELSPLRIGFYAESLRWLCQHRWLWELVTTGGVVYTLALEISFPFLVWHRKHRWLMVSGAVLLHTGIALTMGLVGFSLIMLALVLAFVPAEVVRQALGSFARSVPAGQLPSSGGGPSHVQAA
jgi:hypothetical protein